MLTAMSTCMSTPDTWIIYHPTGSYCVRKDTFASDRFIVNPLKSIGAIRNAHRGRCAASPTMLRSYESIARSPERKTDEARGAWNGDYVSPFSGMAVVW